MLSGSAIARVVLVIVAAALGTALLRHYWPSDDPVPPARTVEAPAVIQPPAPMPAPAPTPAPTPAPAPAQVAAPEPVPPSPTAAEPPKQAATPAPSPDPPVQPQTQAQAQAEIDAAEAKAEPKAVDMVDLNTASVAALNHLKGGGAIGRTIVQHRPYASVDQLLTKRVLSRSVFQRIKDQVTVR